MARWAKILTGAILGVGAVAAAPFTGGGSLLAGASLAASLTGAGVAAGAAGAAGAFAGALAHEMDEMDHEELVKNAKESSFKDGIYEGRATTANEVKKYVDFYMATTALSYYAAKCDGYISWEEQLEIDQDLDAIKKNVDIPDAVKNELQRIINSDITFDMVKGYLDKVGIETLRRLKRDVDEIIEADGNVSYEKMRVRAEFTEYLKKREMISGNVTDSDTDLEIIKIYKLISTYKPYGCTIKSCGCRSCYAFASEVANGEKKLSGCSEIKTYGIREDLKQYL